MGFQIPETCLSLNDIQNKRNARGLSVKSKIETMTSLLVCDIRKSIRRAYLSHR